MSINSYAQNFEDVMLWRALGHIKDGFYIDIGGQHPVIDSVSLAFHEHGWHGIHVEPTPHYAELLRQQRPGDTIIQAVVGNSPGVVRFYEIPNTGISTADATIAEQHRERGFDTHEITVPCITLSAIFDACGERDIHWLKIDVEGFEHQVLSSWGASAARPWIVVVESTLPLTQIETHESWESIIVSHGYSPAYFDGLNRYYVSDAHPEIKDAFLAPPNVFDGFTLNGTASAPFHRLIEARFKEQNKETLAQFEQQKQTANDEIARLSLSLAASENLHAEREQDLSQRLQIAQEDLRRLEQDRAQSEEVFAEQARLSLQEQENLLRTLAQREQEAARQLLAVQLQAAQEQSEQGRNHREQERVLQRQYAEREHALSQQLQVTQDELRRLERDRVQREAQHAEQTGQARQELENVLRTLAQREQEVASRLLAIHEKAAHEKAELLKSHSELAQALHAKHAERELSLAYELQAAQKELRDLERSWATQEQALSRTIHALQSQTQEIQHVQQLQEQQHGFELRAKQEECSRLIQDQAVLEAQLKAQILAEQQTAMRLQQALARTQHALNDIHTSISWRVTLPLRKVASLLARPKDAARLNSVAGQYKADSHANKANFSESHSAQNHQESIATIMHFSTPMINSAISAATTLDELLAYHDQQFVTCAYRTLLGREPDTEGMRYYLSRIRKGIAKIHILKQLRGSSEGKARAIDLQGLDNAIQQYQRGRIPLIGWMYRMITGVEGDRLSECKLRGIENQLFLLSDESNQRFNQLESTLAGLHQLVEQKAYSMATSREEAGTRSIKPSAFAVDDLSDLSPRARDIYFQLKTAAERHSGRAA